jgi:hypothetical protein
MYETKLGNIIVYYHDLGVTVDGVLDWILKFIDLVNTQLLITLYRSLTHTDLCPESITVSPSRFLATDFNTGIITV